MINQLISLHKPNKNSEEWEDDGLTHSSNQTSYICIDQGSTRVWFAPSRGLSSHTLVQPRLICLHPGCIWWTRLARARLHSCNHPITPIENVLVPLVLDAWILTSPFILLTAPFIHQTLSSILPILVSIFKLNSANSAVYNTEQYKKKCFWINYG
jgi:hypothetical protein